MNLLSRAVAAAVLVLCAARRSVAGARAAAEATGLACAVKEVVRCVWFNVDRTNDRLRARFGDLGRRGERPRPELHRGHIAGAAAAVRRRHLAVLDRLVRR